MRGLYDFCKVAAPVFQQWTPKANRMSTPDFGNVMSSIQQAKKPIDTNAIARKAYEDAKAISLNKAVSDPKSKMGKRMSKNNALYEEIKPRMQNAVQNNATRTEQAIREANKLAPLGQRVTDAVKNNKALQAGLVGGTLLAAGAITAKKVYDKKKERQARQQAANTYAMQQAYQQPTYPAPQESTPVQY